MVLERHRGRRAVAAARRGAALRRRPGPPRRHRGPPGAGPRRGRDQRPVRRLARWPTRAPAGPCRSRRSPGCPLGHRRAKPDLVVLLDVDPAVGPGPGRPPAAQRRPAGGRVASPSTSGSGYAFLDLAAADPKRYLVLDARRRPRRSRTGRPGPTLLPGRPTPGAGRRPSPRRPDRRAAPRAGRSPPVPADGRPAPTARRPPDRQLDPVAGATRTAVVPQPSVAPRSADGDAGAPPRGRAAAARRRRDVRGGRRPGAMTHAWLFTGPPGSGPLGGRPRLRRRPPVRRDGAGCGVCHGCHTTLAGTHADVRFVVPEGLSIGVARCARWCCGRPSAPSGGRWQVVVIEDADRLTEAAGNALLKAIEEPPPRTVFLLCAPVHAPRRHLGDHPVAVPGGAAAAAAGRGGRRGAGRSATASRPDVAAWAAAAAQGHVGRARRLAARPRGARPAGRRCWRCRAG